MTKERTDGLDLLGVVFINFLHRPPSIEPAQGFIGFPV
jgi:hypothetical protein